MSTLIQPSFQRKKNEIIKRIFRVGAKTIYFCVQKGMIRSTSIFEVFSAIIGHLIESQVGVNCGHNGYKNTHPIQDAVEHHISLTAYSFNTFSENVTDLTCPAGESKASLRDADAKRAGTDIIGLQGVYPPSAPLHSFIFIFFSL